MKNCNHPKTHYIDWPDNSTVEICDICGMSRNHCEYGQSDWIVVENISAAKEELRKVLCGIEEKATIKSIDVTCKRCGETYTVEPYYPGRDYFCICGNCGKI